MGILIALDGVDASGKETQTGLLYDRLLSEGIAARRLSFPAYDCPSSALVKLYLSGKFGTRPEDVSAYAASTLFAADRFATYRSDWHRDYEAGKVIIADRYVSSNMIHQASKIEDKEEKNDFLQWLYDFEHHIYQLPVPDMTIFLDMPVEYGMKLMRQRKNKADGGAAIDIHERDTAYLRRSYDNALYIANQYHWETIHCVQNKIIRTQQEIHEEIYQKLLPLIQKASDARLEKQGGQR